MECLKTPHSSQDSAEHSLGINVLDTEVSGGWRRLHNEELHNLYTSPYIISVIKQRIMRWVGYAAHMGDIFWVDNLKGRDHSEDLRICR